MFCLGGVAQTVEQGRARAEEMIDNGKALQKLIEMCHWQGAANFNGKPDDLPSAKHRADFKASADGLIAAMQCEQVGLASLLLGGGRNKQDDVIDHAVGLELRKKVGDAVKAGETIAIVHYNDSAKLSEALSILGGACKIDSKPPPPRQLILKIIEGKEKT
jgi:pyrimidine-nucleoside phosphorylase